MLIRAAFDGWLCIRGFCPLRYLHYLTYVKTGDALWRNRSFVQMELLLRAQNVNASSVHHGAIHSSFRLETMSFTSNDRGHSPGLKARVLLHPRNLFVHSLANAARIVAVPTCVPDS